MSTLAEVTGFPVSVEAPGPTPSPVQYQEAELHFSVRAYSKMILHSAKYPHCPINGVLLAKLEKRNAK